MNWFRVAKETMLRDGEGGKRASSRRLWELQSEPAKQAWRLVVSSVGRDPAALEVLLPELNRLLAMRELYQASAFENIRLPMEGRDLLAKGLSSLTQREVMRFNRILLQSSIECMKAFQMDLLFFPSACFRHWLQTPDSRLVKAATRSVHAARFSTIPDADFHLHEGMAASGLACAYDAFHTALSDSERGHWVALMKKCLGLYLESDARSAWTLTTIANANPVGNSGAGLLALALISEEPELAAQVLNSVRRNLWRWLDFCQGPDGGNTEGAQYWHYALQNFLPFALAYERVMGRDDGFLSNPSIRNAMNMVRVSLTNDGGCHGTNDTVPVPVGGVVGWILASRFGDSFGLWYGDHAVRWFSERAHRDLPLAYRPSAEEMLLYRPVGPEVLSAPPFPKVLVLRSVEMGMLRSAPSHTAAFTVSVKGARPPFTHHNQADAGSFSLEFRGERLLIDPGYYKEKPTDHSLLVVDGVAPQAASSWTAALGASFEHGDLCGITMDASRAYGGRTCVRHFVLVGAEALVTLDHTDSPPTALFQCGAPTWAHPDGYAFEIHGNHAQLRVSLFPDVAVTLSPERSLKDVHWGYAFSEARWFPVAAQFAASSSGPYVTVIEEVSGASRPKVTRTHEHVEITLRSGRSLRFLNVAGAWRLLPF